MQRLGMRVSTIGITITITIIQILPDMHADTYVRPYMLRTTLQNPSQRLDASQKEGTWKKEGSALGVQDPVFQM